jgi:RimJ/RimL family protein N-acetyltransferase
MTMPDGTVTLRAVDEDDLALLSSWRNDPEHETGYGDFLPMHRRKSRYTDDWERDGLLTEEQGVLLICLDGEPVGAVQWHPVMYGPNTGSRALNLGIAITPSSRGRGIGSRAQRMLADYLFEHTVAHRVEASTDVTNIAEQRALERAGFTREGILRGAQFRSGEWHDLVSYSRLRTDA